MKLNTHGLIMRGLKAAAGETRALAGNMPGAYIQISYDRADGFVLSNYHVSFGHNSWAQYRAASVVHVVDLDEPATMQQISDAIAKAVAIRNAQDAQAPDAAPESLLRAARVNAGMTQTQAAEALGLPQSQIAKWETGVRKPKMNSLLKMSTLYRCPLLDLIG